MSKEKATKDLYLEYKIVLGLQSALLNILPAGLNIIHEEDENMIVKAQGTAAGRNVLAIVRE